MISPQQCRAARGLLDWSQADLAERARVGIVTVRQLEAGLHTPRRSTAEAIRRALEAAGVELLDENGGGGGLGVRLGKRQSKRL
jgi:transcriptional regulator with XRE-family HTH domain